MSKSVEKGYTLYSEVRAAPVEWLWYPYIAYGKITILQGDPGDGKSMMITNIVAALSSGKKLPGETKPRDPAFTIYQCSEDGLTDTIKPRLLDAGANCQRVAFINEEINPLTLDSDRLRSVIEETRARLVVIDPVQAYLGDAELTNANSIRKVMRRLALWAEQYHCAIVLVGHLNKKENSKDLYRSLGSIDIMAAARSVLQIERSEEFPHMRIVRQVKNSLAPIGDEINFMIDPKCGFCWLIQEEKDQLSVKPMPEEIEENVEAESADTKQAAMARVILGLLSKGPVLTKELETQCQKRGISWRTAAASKKLLGVRSVRHNGQWYWALDRPEYE